MKYIALVTLDLTIKNKYGLEFVNQFDDFGFGEQNTKVVKAGNPLIGEFLWGWKSAKEIDKNLLPDIEEALNNADLEIENGSETIAISIYQDRTEFYPSHDVPFSIPTVDFKSIVIAWRDFVNEAPYEDQKITLLQKLSLLTRQKFRR